MPGDVGEIPFQIGVGIKASIKVRGDQEGVIGDSYEGIKYLLRGIDPEKRAFYIYIGGVDGILVCGLFRIKIVSNGVARPSAPKIATNGGIPGLNVEDRD